MKLYSCKVRVGGALGMEVRKSGVTAAEIMLMREDHGGDDTVIDVVEIGDAATLHDEEADEYTFPSEPIARAPEGWKRLDRTSAHERRRLAQIFSSNAFYVDASTGRVEAMFGKVGPLPEQLDEKVGKIMPKPKKREKRPDAGDDAVKAALRQDLDDLEPAVA